MTFMHDLFHAYILLGPLEETQKEAIKIAKTANCLEKNDGFCDYCKNCVKIEKGVFADLVEVKPEGSSVKIESIRDIIFDSYLSPVEGKKKVYVIYEADKMTLEAQNSILKTLEEPPSQSIFILLSENIKNIIPTVISRCRVIERAKPFKKYTFDKDFVDKLFKVIIEKSLPYEKLDFFNQITNLDDKEAVLEFLSTLYRDVLVAKTNSKVKIVNEEYQDVIKNIANRLCIEEVLKIMDKINKTIEYVKSRGNENIGLFNLLLALWR